jgi:hypothetical protein
MEWPYTGVLPSLPPLGNDFVEPKEVTAGETLEFSRTCPENPANDGWVLNYYLRGGGTVIDFSSTPEGDLHKIKVLPSVTRMWLPGKYSFQAQAVNAVKGEIKQVFQGSITVRQNLALAEAGQDMRSRWETIRDNCLIVMSGKASTDLLDTSVGETTFRRMTYDQILVMHDRAQLNINLADENARAAQGLGTGRTVYTQFTRVT